MDTRIENWAAAGMEDVAAYAPVRIVLLGLVRIVFGLLIVGIGAVAVWAAAAGDTKPKNPGDMPAWWMYVVGAGFAFGGFCLLSGGVGRIISAFARDCYFRGGPGGIAVRFPKHGWFGRYKTVEYRPGWDNVKQLVHFTHRVNLIPVSRALHIELKSGGTIVIDRYLFSSSVKQIQRRLLAIQALVGR